MSAERIDEIVEEARQLWDDAIDPKKLTLDEAIEATEQLISALDDILVAMREDADR